MFAVVRTGGKQYRVAPGDKIVVEKLDGNAGDKVTLGDVLLAGDGGSLKSTDGLTVAAEIVAQAKGDKVTVFKKRRRHNYRRKKGHRQQHTILKIVAIGDHKDRQEGGAEGGKAAPKAESPQAGRGNACRALRRKGRREADAAQAGDVAGKPTENPAPRQRQGRRRDKAARRRPAPAKKPDGRNSPSTKNAAPAKGAAKKSPKAK